MEKKEAEQILREKKEKEASEIEAQKTIREAKLKEQQEKEAAEKARRKKEIEAEKKKYPKSQSEIFIKKCWNCKEKNLDINKLGEIISKATYTMIVVTCPRCGSYNICRIFNGSTTSRHDRFLSLVDLR